MAWEERISPGWFEEMPFFVAAAIAYGALFLANPQIRWGTGERPPDRSVPIEFVAQLPAPSPNLAPALGGGDDRTPRLGPAEFVPEKVRAGAPDAPPKPHSKPKPAKPKPYPHPKHATIAKATPPAPVPVPVRPAPDPAVVAASRAAAREAAREKIAQEAAVRREIVAEKAAAAKAAAEKRASQERERRRQLAEARAAETRRKLELNHQLATMSDPDETIDAAPNSGGGAAVPAGGGALSGARKTSAAAALADAADPTDAGDAAGRGGADLLDDKARGGGSGPDGSGVSWTMEGPVGNRRVLKRAAPTSPDWVGARGLDLTVTVRFQVLPEGTVKPGAVIQKTSGFPEIDKRALDALKSWRFEAAAGAPQTWGRVTFRFTSA
jgi:TonB family protein